MLLLDHALVFMLCGFPAARLSGANMESPDVIRAYEPRFKQRGRHCISLCFVSPLEPQLWSIGAATGKPPAVEAKSEAGARVTRPLRAVVRWTLGHINGNCRGRSGSSVFD